MTVRHKVWLTALAMAVTGTLTLTAASAAMAEPVTGATNGRQHDLAAFEHILRQQEAAWADEDGTAFAATFTGDGDMVTVTGDYLIGRQGIAAGMQYFFDNYIPPSRIVRLDEHIRFVEPDLAII